MKSDFALMRNKFTSPNVQAMVEARLGEKAGTFITSVLDLAGEDKNLAMCNPMDVMKEAMKAASLDLPVSKQLGFAYVIAYKNKPAFQMGYKGFIQLAMRTGQYQIINADCVYEGEKMIIDRVKGSISIEGDPTGDNPTGYFSYMQLTSGFEKGIGWSLEKVKSHAVRYSPAYRKGADTPWKTNFDEMAKKTMLLRLIPTYGPMSIQISEALKHSGPIESDQMPDRDPIQGDPIQGCGAKRLSPPAESNADPAADFKAAIA